MASFSRNWTVTLVAGDDDDADGYFASTNLKATDLTAGQGMDFGRAGGLGGAYLTEGTSTHFLKRYYAAANNVIVVVTTANQDGSAGRTIIVVEYSVPNSGTPVLA